MAPKGAGSHATVERSSGGVVVRRVEGRLHVLLIRDPYRNWGLPKGHLEKGETAAEAAVREVGEETGLTPLTLGPRVAEIDWYFRQKGVRVHKFCTFFLIHSPEGEATPEAAEGITECIWLDFEAALARISYENAGAVLGAAQEMLTQDPPALKI